MKPATEHYLLHQLTTSAMPKRNGSEALLRHALTASVVVALGLGLLLNKTPFSLETPMTLARKMKVTVSLDEKKEEKKPPPKAIPKKPIDLTKPMQVKSEEKKPTITVVKKETVRAVYGLKRVFAVGLGGGGNTDGANDIVSKLGNTLEKDKDTLTATLKDLKGELPKGPVTSVTTVTSKPILEEGAKPEYTDTMKENRVQGVVSARILVDIDGLVKQVEVLNDLGFGTKEAVEEACRKLRFKPALEGAQAVATWIVFKFRFVLQE